MNAMPAHEPEPKPYRWPDHLLTIDEYLTLPETEFGYTELLEGRVLMSPSASKRHMKTSLKLAMQFSACLPAHLDVVQEFDVDLELAPPDEPGFSRRPDLIIYDRAADELPRNDQIIPASHVLIAVEVVSPGSRRTDRVIKHGEYADAGIPHYWLVDIDPPRSLLAYTLTEEFGYVGHEVSGKFETEVPFPMLIDLDALA